jgi:hypothetical protein
MRYWYKEHYILIKVVKMMSNLKNKAISKIALKRLYYCKEGLFKFSQHP